MTTPPEQVSIVCPECHATYQTWTRRSMNLGLDNFSKKYIREMSTGKCPICHTIVELGSLIVGEDGVWRVG
jgi:endogenous inhibitor of DNA gyrase (YacG/DUF329 family)